MLPEMSTASIKSRPVVGSSTGSPVTCGRAKATMSIAHPNQSQASRQRDRVAVGAWTSDMAKALASGTNSALSFAGAGRDSQRTNKGSGNAAKAKGQANSITCDYGVGAWRLALPRSPWRRQAPSLPLGAWAPAPACP